MIDSRKLGRAKWPIFSTISFAAVFIVTVYASSFISNLLSLHSVVLENRISPGNQQKLIKSSIPNALLGKKDDVQESCFEDQRHHLDPFQPPLTVTDEERIAWFKKTLPKFEILKSTGLARKFDARIREFLETNQCKIQFFMTWISSISSFGQREFFAIESLFKAHSNGCLVILSKTMDSAYGYGILKPLIDFGIRILVVTPDLPFLLKNTPAESWFLDFKKGDKDPGEIPFSQNLSNLIRLAVLYKYGGVYLDTDFIVLKDFSGLRNSIGAQSVDLFGNWTRLNNAVLIFNKNHPLLYKFLEEFASTFDGNRWGHNGPYLVSRVVERIGRENEFNLTVLPPMAFYPVGWTKIKGLFDKPVNRDHSKWVEAKVVQLRRAAYGVHLWNRQSSGLRIEDGSIISRLISNTCVICKKICSFRRKPLS